MWKREKKAGWRRGLAAPLRPARALCPPQQLKVRAEPAPYVHHRRAIAQRSLKPLAYYTRCPSYVVNRSTAGAAQRPLLGEGVVEGLEKRNHRCAAPRAPVHPAKPHAPAQLHAVFHAPSVVSARGPLKIFRLAIKREKEKEPLAVAHVCYPPYPR